MFDSGQTDVHHDESAGGPSVLTDKKQTFQEDRHFTIDRLHSFFSGIFTPILVLNPPNTTNPRIL